MASSRERHTCPGPNRHNSHNGSTGQQGSRGAIHQDGGRGFHDTNIASQHFNYQHMRGGASIIPQTTPPALPGLSTPLQGMLPPQQGLSSNPPLRVGHSISQQSILPQKGDLPNKQPMLTSTSLSSVPQHDLPTMRNHQWAIPKGSQPHLTEELGDIVSVSEPAEDIVTFVSQGAASKEVQRKRDDKAFTGNTNPTRLMTTLPHPLTGEGEGSKRESKSEIWIANLDTATALTQEDKDEEKEGSEINNGQRPVKVTKILATAVPESQRMQEHKKSYHEAITGEEAERRLKKCGSHCYLTRYSEIGKCYVLTTYRKKPTYVMKHFKIYFKHYLNGQKVYKLEGLEKEFDGIGEMLQHYESNRIDPALASIGRPVSVDDYNKSCTIL